MTPLPRDALWQEIGAYFEGDPGEMPEVHFAADTPGLAPAVFARLREAGRMVPSEFWDLELERAVPLAAVPNAAALVIEGRASGLVAWFEDVVHEGVTLPPIALMVHVGELAVFWDVRDAWDATSAAALVSLLVELRGLAPGARFVEEPSAGEAVGRHLLDVIEAWDASRGIA